MNSLNNIYYFCSMGKVSLKDLSLHLKLSVSTVSKALRDSHEISDETKKVVLEAAKELGYHANPYAGSLRNQKSKTIALIVPELNNDFFIQAISGVEAVARENGYHVLVYSSKESYQEEKNIAKHLLNGRVEGVIASIAFNTTDTQHFEDIINEGIPVVFFDRVPTTLNVTKIITNDYEAGYNATELLIKNGCKDIAFFSLNDSLSIESGRKQGYLDALKKYNIPFNKQRLLKCVRDGEETNNSYEKIFKFLQLKKGRPDAVFASVENLAIKTLRVCNELNIKIPKQLKLICFSNYSNADLLTPPLSTIAQPAYEMGSMAAQDLFFHLKHEIGYFYEKKLTFKSNIIQRESTE